MIVKKAIVFTAKYSQCEDDSTLADELISQLELNNYKVTVFAIGDIIMSTQNEVRNREEFLFQTSGVSKFVKYLKFWPKLFREYKRKIDTEDEIDLMVAFAPLSILLPIFLLKTNKVKKRVCVLFDFFPIHQQQIGIFGPVQTRLFYIAEKWLLKKFDVITGMTPRNVEKIKSYYRINSNKVRVKLLHLWGVKEKPLYLRKNSDAVIKMVFGGQIVPGRALSKLIDMVLLINKTGFSISLTIFSQGIAFEALKRQYNDQSNIIIFKRRIPREEYIDTISSFDVGAIVTDERVNMPTFPSKIIDYINASIPCFCMIEKESDISDVIQNNNYLYVNNFDISSEEVIRAINFLSRLKTNIPYLEANTINKFKVQEAVSTILSF